MFKKLMVLFIAFSMLSVQAHATTKDGLKAAFDELNYSLTVEWDQKDKTFYSEQMKKFTASLRELQADGLTSEELVTFVKSEVKNERVAKDLETAFNLISINKMSSQDASKYMVETMKRSYSSGANYQGEATVILASLGALFVIAAIILAASGGGLSSSGGGGYTCSQQYVCDTTCYYDYYYGYTCYDDCYYACY